MRATLYWSMLDPAALEQLLSMFATPSGQGSGAQREIWASGIMCEAWGQSLSAAHAQPHSVMFSVAELMLS